jgi:hypothetical protein
MRASSSWAEVQEALRTDDLQLAPRGGGLVLQSLSGKGNVTKASDLGYGYSSLIKRFGAGFPGHPHTWLAERVLGERDDPLIE